MRITSQRKVGKQGIRRGSELFLINVWMTASEIQQIADVGETVTKATGIKVTRSYIMREGARLYCLQLIRELKKAKSGELHAKKRKDALYENQGKEESRWRVVPAEDDEQQPKPRRRGTVGDYRSKSVPRPRSKRED